MCTCLILTAMLDPPYSLYSTAGDLYLFRQLKRRNIWRQHYMQSHCLLTVFYLKDIILLRCRQSFREQWPTAGDEAGRRLENVVL